LGNEGRIGEPRVVDIALCGGGHPDLIAAFLGERIAMECRYVKDDGVCPGE
jgi:hypothetical protein